MNIHLRWGLRRDLPAALAIEHASFEFPWSEDDFIRALRQRNIIWKVAEIDERVLGYVLYELHRTNITILNMAVHPDRRYEGIGKALVQNLAAKLIPDRRARLKLLVRERNLDAQLFFKALGFRAIDVVRGAYIDTDEDGILFQLHVRQLAKEERRFV